MQGSSTPNPKTRLNADTAVTYVKGVGPKRAAALKEIQIATFMDLLYHFPRRYLDRSTITPIAKLKVNTFATILGKVYSQNYVKTRRRGYYQLLVGDETGHIRCIWFNGIQYIRKVFENGDMVALSGKVEFYRGLQLVHPDYDKLEKGEWDTTHTARIIPLYPATAQLKKVGLDSRGFRRLFRKVFANYQFTFDELIPAEILERLSLMPLNRAIHQIHFPASGKILQAARRRFKFEELFYLQLLLGVKRRSIQAVKKDFRYPSPGKLIKKIYAALPFELTKAQKQVVHEIWQDMQGETVMNRLLQGDVGSGKTVVALLSASIAIGNGLQAVLMAPTEILAEQHYTTLKQMGTPAGIKVALLIGGQKKTEREDILKRIRANEHQLIVGTHALIQKSVDIDRLALAIIDEQHRFGVTQRGQLIEKGLHPDVLVMTATPIPRTLSMTIYGDMDVSVIDQMPARKGKIITRIVHENQLAKVYDFVKQQIKKGHQVYVVYPLIEVSEKLDLQAAIQGYEYLKARVFNEYRLALLHGGMATAEKDHIMHAFRDGTIDILVSTTVIEVGVDNPNATVMIIENAERFGLTQIHQLRGRIGRGQANGVCVLVERKHSETAHQRLQILAATTNGFEISEQDLKLRGPGEFYSTRQHGFPKMKIADLITDQKLMQTARRAALGLLQNDPHLRKSDHQPMRTHLIDNYAEYMAFVDVL